MGWMSHTSVLEFPSSHRYGYNLPFEGDAYWFICYTCFGDDGDGGNGLHPEGGHHLSKRRGDRCCAKLVIRIKG